MTLAAQRPNRRAKRSPERASLARRHALAAAGARALRANGHRGTQKQAGDHGVRTHHDLSVASP